MLKRLIFLLLCFAGVCAALVPKGIQEERASHGGTADTAGITQEVAVFPQLGHSGYITSVAFRPDGKQVLSGSTENIKLWDVESGREIKTFSGHNHWVTSVSFSPDGKKIISGSFDNTIKLWDVESGREIKTFSGHNDWVTSVCFNYDGKQILSGSYDHTIRFWDVESGRVIHTFTGHSSTVESVSFSPDGKKIISGSYDNTIKLWDIERGNLIKTFSGHTDRVYSIAFSPDGKRIVSGSNDRTVKIWDIETGQEIYNITGLNSLIRSVAFSPDGEQILASESNTSTIITYNIITGQFKFLYGHTEIVESVCFSPDGKQILSGSTDKTIKLWDTYTGQEIKTFSGFSDHVRSMVLSPNGKQILSGSTDKTINLWDTYIGSKINNFIHHFDGGVISGLSALAFSPDGNHVFSSAEKEEIKQWNLSTGQEIRTFSGHSSAVNSIAVNHDGSQIISGSSDGTVKLWDVATGQIIRTLSNNYYLAVSVAFSPNGNYIVSGGQFPRVRPDGTIDGSINLWDVATGNKIWNIISHSSLVDYVAFSPDSRYIVSGFHDGTIKLWDVETGNEIMEFLGHSSSVYSISFNPDGNKILSGSLDRTIKLWDIVTGKEIKTFSEHLDSVSSVSFTPDGKRILSGSSDGTVRLWDVATGKEIASFISFSGSDSQVTAASRNLKTEVAVAASDISGEWIVITPDGYYAASPRGDRYLNVRMGNKVTGVDSFRHIFYNPDVVKARLQGLPDPASKKSVTIQDLLKFFPSAITLRVSGQRTAGSGQEVLSAFSTTTTGTANLEVNIIDDNQPIQSVKIFVNGNLVGQDDLSKVTGTRGLKAEKASLTVTGNQKTLSFNIPLTLDPGDNLIEVVSFNGYAESRRNTRVTWQTAAGYKPELPNLWILAVGVNEYDDSKINDLSYCGNDAREIVNSFKAQEGKRYAKVNSLLIADGEEMLPTAKNIRNGFTFLNRAGPRDIILLFLAGHGVNGKDGVFQYLPRDAVVNRDESFSNTITSDEISRVLETPGKRLIFIDACHSGGIDNNRMIRQMMNTNAFVFASSKGNEYSLEMDEYEHGVFTYSIKETMKNPAARYGGALSVMGLSGNVSIEVPKLTDNQQNPVGYSLGFYDFVIGE